MITVRSRINIAHQSVPEVIPAVQGDTGRSILFTLADFTIPAGATARYFITKPSGLAVYNDATIDGNNVLVDLTAQSIAEAGDAPGQVRISVGDEIVTSFDFILHVDPFRGIDAVESSTEANIFDQAVAQAAEEFQTEAETIAAEVIESIPADYTALSNEVSDLKSALDDLENFIVPIDSEISIGTMTTNAYFNPSNGINGSVEYGCRSPYIDINIPNTRESLPLIFEANFDKTIYKYAVFGYSSHSTTDGTESYTDGDWSTADKVFIKPSTLTNCFRFCVVRRDGTGTITAEQAASIAAQVKLMRVTDSTLSLYGIPADAKAVGETINTVEETINAKSLIRREAGDKTDFNDFVDSGYYGLDSQTYEHSPVGYQTSGGVLLVLNYYGTVYISQLLITYRSTTKSIRMYTRSGSVASTGGWWNDWVECSNLDDALCLTDALWRIGTSNTTTSNGMQFARNAIKHEVVLNNAWDGTSVCAGSIVTYDDTDGYFKTDVLYYLDFCCDDENVTTEIYYNDANGDTTKVGAYNKPSIIKFPSEAKTFLVRVRYNKANVTVTNVNVFVCMYELTGVTKNIVGATMPHLINNQRIAMFGDSMMTGTIKTPSTNQTRCVGRYIQNELRIPVDDVAMGSIGYITHAHLSYNILELAKSVDLTGCTYFICCAGDNDGSYPIGDYTDTNANFPNDYAASDSGATVMGNIYKLVNYLHTTYDNMTVIFISKPNATTSGVFPTYRRTDGTWIRRFNDELKKFCGYYGCGYINMFENAGIDGWLLQQIVEQDGVHYKIPGYQKLSLFIAEELRKFTGTGDYYLEETNLLINTSPLVNGT